MKCWTYIGTKLREFDSFLELGIELDVDIRTISQSRAISKAKGHGSSFEIFGHVVVLGSVPTDRREHLKALPARLAGSPLLRGHVTHRLGVYRGGQW